MLRINRSSHASNPIRPTYRGRSVRYPDKARLLRLQTFRKLPTAEHLADALNLLSIIQLASLLNELNDTSAKADGEFEVPEEV